jgi:antitoxin PrlF
VITSRITSKAQTTIPQPVRVALGLKAGDDVAYQIEGDRVVLTKSRQGQSADDPFAAFSEWSSPADQTGYADF